MVIIPMVEIIIKKMSNNINKFILFSLLLFFLYLFFPFSSSAFNYGSGVYNLGLYSSSLPSVISVPDAGGYNTPQRIVLNTENNNYIRYSFDTPPIDCTSGLLYEEPILVDLSKSIYVRACDVYNNSFSKTFIYIISKEQNTSNRNNNSGGGSINKKIEPLISNKDIISPNSVLVFNKNLKLKTKGIEVEELQKYLINNKYFNGVPDGYFGPNTEAAVIRFQKDCNLFADGIVGLKTINCINQFATLKDNISIKNTSPSYVFLNNLKLGMKDNNTNEIYQLQKYLNTHGYVITSQGVGSPGNESHYFGQLTKSALIKFQIVNKLYPDGILGIKTREIINTLKQ